MNSFLSDIHDYENFILSKSLYLSMIRYEDGTRIAHGEGELQQEEEEKISNICAREEREAGASPREGDHA